MSAKRILSLFLTAVMVFTLMPGVTAYAVVDVVGIANKDDLSPAVSGRAAEPEKPESSPKVTPSPTLAESTTVWFGGYQWVIIGWDGEGVASVPDTATLLFADANANTTKPSNIIFHSSSNQYASSDLQSAMNNISTFLDITERERSAIKARSLTGGSGDILCNEAELINTSSFTLAAGSAGEGLYINGYYVNSTDTFDWYAYHELRISGALVGGEAYNGVPPYHPDKVAGNDDTLTTECFWPLSVAEASLLNSSIRAYDANWRLRSPGNSAAAASVSFDGTVVATGPRVSGTLAVRPAFNLDLSSVLFTSAAAGGKSSATVGSGILPAEPPAGAVKFTMLDAWDATTNTGGQRLDVYGLTGRTEIGTLTFSYDKSTVTTGTNQYISCVLVDGSGEVKYYGKLEDLTGGSGSGTVSVNLYGTHPVADGTYTLKIFSEQAYGDNYTDFVSEPFEIEITISSSGIGVPTDNTAPTVSGISPANNATDVAVVTNTLSVTFSEEMNIDPNIGAVTLNNGASVTNGTWQSDKKTIEYDLSGLAYDKQYTVSISGFKDIAGNEMVADSANSFSTYALGWEGIPGSFADLTYGYTAGSSVTYTIKNTGNSTVTDISAAVTAGGSDFSVTENPAASLASGETTTVTVTSAIGLNSSTTPYVGTLTVTWNGNTTGITQSLSQKVNKAPRSISAPTKSVVTHNSVTLNAVTPSAGSGDGTVEYAYSTTNTAPASGWKTGTVFNGLAAKTPYYFFARITNGANYENATSAGVQITTGAGSVKSINVGMQTGILTAGTAGDAAFTVTTANITRGSAITLNTGGVVGISLGASTNVTTGNSTDITINTTAETPAGDHVLTLTIDGVTSGGFNLKVNPAVISIAAITGVTAPAYGETPVTSITETAQYNGTVSWIPADNPFQASTVYTATITLTAKQGYTLTGVAANYFTVADAASVSNDADSGVITAIFPTTGTAPDTVVNIAAITGVTAPAYGETPVTSITETAQYNGTVSWSPADNPFQASTAYTATITLTAKQGYTLTGVAANYFTAADAASVSNDADSGVITAIFPTTGTAPDTVVSAAAVTVTAPVTGNTPVTTAPAGGAGYTCGTVTWSPQHSAFQSGTRYTAAITLTAKPGYTFTGLNAAAINGQTAAVTSNTGSEVTLSYEFSATHTPSGGSSGRSNTPQTPAYQMITIKDQNGKTIGSFNTTGHVRGGVISIKPSSQSDSYVFDFNLLRLKELESANKGGKFVITLSGMEYELPFDMINNITGLADFLGNANLRDYSLDLTIKRLTGDGLTKARETFRKAYPGGEVSGDFFDIGYVLYKKGSEVDFDANQFDSAVAFSLTTTKKCNAVFKYDAAGGFSFVPAKFSDRKAAIKTKTHSVYVAALNSVTFSDVKAGEWYEPFVVRAANKGLVTGYAGLFRPSDEVTRAEFIQMIVNAIQLPEAKIGTKGYADADKNSWYYGAVMKAKSAGLLVGFTDVDFKPNQAITREEMSSVLASVLRRHSIPVTQQAFFRDQVFADHALMDKKYLDDIELVYRTNLMAGTGGGMFSPKDITTRAQAATVQIRLLEILGLIDVRAR